MTRERFLAAMVLSGVGDALGYKSGSWEFCHSGEIIHKELEELGGIDNIHVKGKNWIVSDDTVMHLATAEAIMEYDKEGEKDKEILYSKIAAHYKLCMRDMTGRAPGLTCMNWVHHLKPKIKNGYQIPFNERGGGCGAAMRAMCIGLRYPRPNDLQDLIAVSVESGRMSHHHPTGYLGALASALFTSYAIQGQPIISWGAKLMDTLDDAKEYIKHANCEVENNLRAWSYFKEKWNEYLEERGIRDGKSEPIFPQKYGIKERDAFYKSLSFSGWGGSSGHDAPMIAYDAILSSGKDWRELCSRSMFHSGDSDSTGVIAACCYGAMHGFEGVPKKNYKDLEYRRRLENAADFFYQHYEGGGSKTESENPGNESEMKVSLRGRKMPKMECEDPILEAEEPVELPETDQHVQETIKLKEPAREIEESKMEIKNSGNENEEPACSREAEYMKETNEEESKELCKEMK